MRFKGRKWASPFFIISLAIAGIFGASATVINTEIQETPIVEKADAANFTRRIWLDKSGCTWMNPVKVSFTGKDGTFYTMINSSGNIYYYDYVGSSAPTKVVFRHSDVKDANCNTAELDFSTTNNKVCNGYRITSQGSILNGNFVLTQRCFIVGSMSNWSVWDGNAVELTWQTDQWKGSSALSSGSSFKVLYENTTGSPTWKGYSILQSASDQAVYYGQLSGDGDNDISVNTTGTYDFYLKKDENKMWVPKLTTKVTFNSNGGSGTMGDQTINCHSATNLNSNSFTYTGYSFAGWATSSSGSVVYSDGQSVTLNTAGTLNLYAKWTPAVYTITYDRNKNTGLQATQSKNHGTSVTAYTPGSNPLTAVGWNPSAFKRFLHWNTQYDDKGATVNAGGTISSNASFMLYYIEDWYDYRYKSDSDSDWIDLIHDDTGLDTSQYQVQFKPATSHLLNQGDKLYFQVSTNGKSTWSDLSVTTYSGWNNNYSTETGIKLTTNDTIFLKITNAGVYDCWVPGVTDYTVRVDYGSGQSVYSMVGWGHSGGGKEQMKATTLVQGLKDTKLDIGYEGNYYRGYRNGGCFGIEERTVEGVTNLYFTVNGMFEVYLIKEDGEHWDNIYVSIDNDASATMFGNEFMDWVVCDPTGRTLPTYWNRVATFYGNLADDTKDIVYNTIGSETGTVVERAVARYDYAVAHHPELDKFIKDSGGTPRSAVNITRQFNPIDVFSEESGGTTIIIIVASSVSLLSITALSVLLVRKRKRNEQ